MPSDGIDFDKEIGLDAEIFGTVAVALLDAAFGVAAVAAHVPLAGGAGRTRHGIGPAHNADNEIADLDAAFRRRLLHLAERLMADHQPLLAGRSPAIVSGHDFAVGAADPERQSAHQDRAIRLWRLGNVFDTR